MEDRYATRRLRLALMAALAGMAIVFLIATIDALRLLGTMRAEDKILRDAALARTNHLASIQTSIWLTHAYLGDYFLDSDQQNSGDYLAKIQDAWSRAQSDLANYRPSALDEDLLVKRLGDVLNQHWRAVSQAMGSARRGQSLYTDEILPLRTSVIEITTQLEDIDAKQTASTEAQIQDQFESLGSRLSRVLSLALFAAVLLGAGCLFYISRIERQNGRRYQEIVGARKALEQLSVRMLNAQETERRAISRELHDQVGQTLNALLVDAAVLAKRVEGDDVSRKYLDNIRRFADSSVNSIRDIALLLRPSMLDDLGLIPALEWQAREVARRSGIKITVAAENVPDSFPDQISTCVYRIVQEALQNVSRHSDAKSAVVTVRDGDGSLSLRVEDDGHGFDTSKTKGLGLLGMEERVRQLRGRFEIRSEPGKGASIHVMLPTDAAVLTPPLNIQPRQ